MRGEKVLLGDGVYVYLPRGIDVITLTIENKEPGWPPTSTICLAPYVWNRLVEYVRQLPDSAGVAFNSKTIERGS